MNINQVVFVYAKDKKIKVIGLEDDEIRREELLTDNWEHTATMDACMWIEHLHNTSRNWNEDIKSLSTITNKLTKP